MWVKRAALNFTLEGAQTWVCFQNILVITITTDIYFLFWGERNNKWKGAIQAPQYLQTQVGEWGDSPQLLTLGKSLEISEYPQVTWSSPSHFHMWPCSWVVDRALPGRLSSHVMAERPSLLAAGGQGSVASWAQLVKIDHRWGGPSRGSSMLGHCSLWGPTLRNWVYCYAQSLEEEITEAPIKALRH